MKVSEGIFDTEKSNKSSEPSHAVIMPPNTRCRTWCGVAAIVLHTQLCVSGKYRETRNSCLLLVENRMGVAT